MQIDSGLFAHMVLQQTKRGVSDQPVAGVCQATGPVTVQITARGKTLPGWSAKKVGTAAKGKFTARLAGLPVGGPYAVTLRVGEESLQVDDVLVGDVWVLAGQSNMEGIGLVAKRLKSHAAVRAFFMNDRWDLAEDPIHNLGKAVDQVHRDLNGGTPPMRDPAVGTGPGVAFGQEMHRLTKVPQGLLACAHGGTSMAQWDPAKKKLAGKSLYGATLRRVRKNGGKIAGILWYQGESDANPAAAAVYTAAMKKLVTSFRKDFADPALPVAIVQIARVIDSFDGMHWNNIQEQQRLLPSKIDHLATVPAIDLDLDDLIHIAGEEQHRLGRRLAGAMQSLRTRAGKQSQPMELQGVSIARERGRTAVVLEFDHVVGRLKAPGRPAGFAVRDDSGNPYVYRIDLDQSRVILRIKEPPGSDVNGLSVHYGLGRDNHCNITDEADRSLPVFGPLALGKPRALTGFAKTFEVSALQPSAGKLEKLGYPENVAALHLTRRPGTENFTHIRPLFAARAPEDTLAWFRFAIDCPEKMVANLLFGYDGPVKVFLDGKAVFHDPHGTNPAVIDGTKIPVKLAPGRHEILIALASNDGKAWGVFLRLERTGLSAKQLKQGPVAYAMPAFAE